MNIPKISFVTKYGHTLVCASCAEGSYINQGAVWSVTDVATGRPIAHGTAMGWGGSGVGCMIQANSKARKRANDYLRKFKPKNPS